MPKSTKNQIVSTLAELLQTKRLDDITVTELVERCNISRQAFYYHFSDLYGVVDYGIQQFLEELELPSPDRWRAALEKTLTLLRENRALVLNVYRAYERSYVEHDLRQWIMPLVEARTRMAARKYSVTEDQTAFELDLSTDADIPAQIQTIVDAALAKGVTLTGLQTARKNITKMRKTPPSRKQSTEISARGRCCPMVR